MIFFVLAHSKNKRLSFKSVLVLCHLGRKMLKIVKHLNAEVMGDSKSYLMAHLPINHFRSQLMDLLGNWDKKKMAVWLYILALKNRHNIFNSLELSTNTLNKAKIFVKLRSIESN
jgi:hypothetical protein